MTPPQPSAAAASEGLRADGLRAGGLRAGGLRECLHCGLFQRLPALPPHTAARCPRCLHVLRRRRIDPIGRPLALCLSGLLLLLTALQTPFISLDVRGLGHATQLETAPLSLEEHGMVLLAVVVLATTMVVPLLRLLALGYVLASTRQGRKGPHLTFLFRWTEILKPWSMVEIFFLGLFVAYTRLTAVAQVDVGPACYAMAGLIMATAAADTTLDPDAVWERLGREPAPLPQGRDHNRRNWVGCDICGCVTARPARRCARCNGVLRFRKPHSITRTWSLLIAAMCLYLPANVLPVLTLITFGNAHPATILSGIRELADAGLWPLALLVFVASMTVPVLKIVGMMLMLITSQRGARWRLRERTRLYRIIEFIGRWSMIDVFVVAILTAVLQVGNFVSTQPNLGAVAFCLVVILTMLAAIAFDPRLMWDAVPDAEI